MATGGDDDDDEGGGRVETPPWPAFTRALAAIERVSKVIFVGRRLSNNSIGKNTITRDCTRNHRQPLPVNPQSDVRALRELYDQYGEALTNRMLPDGTGACVRRVLFSLCTEEM
jgi:hypothetical protein